MNEKNIHSDLNRRDFLKGGSLATLMMMLGGVELKAQDKASAAASAAGKPVGPPVKCAVIGCGVWGREVLAALGRLPNAPVTAICDNYGPFLRRAHRELAPNAEPHEDYQQVLASKDVEAVFVVTPTHQHRQIVLDALAAGKHVYCEAPLGANLEDARAIAAAAKAAAKQYFQAGLQVRSEPQMHFLLDFIRTGAMGRNLEGRSQWNKKHSWRRISPNPEREQEINWRLRGNSSTGLVGELGIHQVDVASWIYRSRPVSVTGFGSLRFWTDGRKVPDTVQAVFEYPDGVNYTFASTIANSFDGAHDVFYGSDAALMIRDNRAWMFKEADSPLLGWEVYARKDQFYNETGIALVANATKLDAQGDNSGAAAGSSKTSLDHALEAFVNNAGVQSAAVEDFSTFFDASDSAALNAYLADIVKNFMPAAGYQEGYDAAVTVIKANEAILKGQKITYKDEWFVI